MTPAPAPAATLTVSGSAAADARHETHAHAHAHTGLAHGHHWTVPDGAEPPASLQLPQGATWTWQYRLLVHPRTRQPLHDDHHRLVYLPAPDRRTNRRSPDSPRPPMQDLHDAVRQLAG